MLPTVISWSDKAHPQDIPPKTWTTLTFNGVTKATMAGGRTVITAQLYPRFAASKAWTAFDIRLDRHLPDGTVDVTAHDSRFIPPATISRERPLVYTTEMYTEPDKPISIEVWHDGTSPVTLATRVFKLVNVAQP